LDFDEACRACSTLEVFDFGAPYAKRPSNDGEEKWIIGNLIRGDITAEMQYVA